MNDVQFKRNRLICHCAPWRLETLKLLKILCKFSRNAGTKNAALIRVNVIEVFSAGFVEPTGLGLLQLAS